MNGVLPVKRALVSVADKSGLVDVGRLLAKHGITLVSSGTAASVLREAGVPVTPVSEVTGFPEMLDGRVKTLHPNVHAGILADKRNPEHLRQLERQRIEPFDLVIVNLYPFVQTVRSGASDAQVIEQIDIGGPAMVRAAAKNFGSVGVVVSPDDYGQVMGEIERLGGLSESTRLRLARKAFEHTMRYDAAIADWLARPGRSGGPSEVETELPQQVDLTFRRRETLRYGENPHQRGALYAASGGPGPLGGADVLQGKEMSFNNWLDAEAARAVVALFEEPAAAVVKHHNPCGAAQGPTLAEAYARALEGDPVSAYGGIVAFNGEVDEAAARAMADVFTEVVVAPGYTPDALTVFAEKRNLRVVRSPISQRGGIEVRPIDWGALVQDADTISETREDMKVVTVNQPTKRQWDDLLFAWKVAARVKSNAIVLASNRAVVAVGAGQMNRLTAVDIAARHAGERARECVLASDAYFPFRDGVDRAAEAGVGAIIQPGGSIRDGEVIASADEHGMAMVFTGRRHFRH